VPQSYVSENGDGFRSNRKISLSACHLAPRMVPLSATTPGRSHFCHAQPGPFSPLRVRRVAICRVAMVTEAINLKASHSDDISRSDVICQKESDAAAEGDVGGRVSASKIVGMAVRIRNKKQPVAGGWCVLRSKHHNIIHLAGGKTPSESMSTT
jgi:hypothetical protein